MNYKNIAIITARGGSKRIPRKNIKEFLGQPIISYSIKAAIKSGIFDTVMVSTDDEEIAIIAKKYGAEVPFFRSKETSNDYATTEEVIKEVILEYLKIGKEFDYICCIYPTALFATSQKLNLALDLLYKSRADSLMPIVKFSYPPQRCVVLNNGKIKMKYPEYSEMRSQDLEELYHDCGQFYFFKSKEFLESGAILSDNTIALKFSEMEVQDIDSEEDWKLAEIKYQLLFEESDFKE